MNQLEQTPSSPYLPDMLVFESVGFSYSSESSPAISDISLSISPGERVAVMGANGSGKSTFALLAAGLLQPTSGRVEINSPNGCGIVFQNPDNQIISISVEREMAFPLECRQVNQPEIRRIVDIALDRFDFSGRANHPPHRLSGGEKQKLAIASSVIAGPGILVLDEPAAHLDPAGSQLLRESIDATVRENQNLTVIVVTQSPSDAMLCSRLLVFRNGRIAVDGDPATILRDKNLCGELAIQMHYDFVISERDTDRMKTAATADNANEPATEPLISLSDVEFSWDRKAPLLRSLSLQIRRNAITGIAARSGGGKTTLASLLAGLVKPTNGEIQWLDSHAAPDLLLDSVGYVFQFPERQIFCETVTDEISFGLKQLKLPEHEMNRRVRESLGLVGLDPDSFAGRSPLRLSGGEMRKVALASVLALQRPLVIYDEPIAELDCVSRIRFVSTVRDIRSAGVTQILISHDADFLFEVCDNLILIRDGSVEYAGSKFSLADRPDVFGKCGVAVPIVLSKCLELSCVDYMVRHGISSVEKLADKLKQSA